MAGKKVFTAGSVLNAADVNDYLMDQAVMVFAGTAARGSAISAPTEGMMTFLQDTNSVEQYDGTGWVSINNSTINTQSGTTYTLAATDAGKMIVLTSSSAVTLTIGTAIQTGQRVDIIQDGTGTVTWSAGGGTVTAYNSVTRIAGRYGAITVFGVSANTYRIVGNIA